MIHILSVVPTPPVVASLCEAAEEVVAAEETRGTETEAAADEAREKMIGRQGNETRSPCHMLVSSVQSVLL